MLSIGVRIWILFLWCRQFLLWLPCCVNSLLLLDKYEYKQIIWICINCSEPRVVCNLIPCLCSAAAYRVTQTVCVRWNKKGHDTRSMHVRQDEWHVFSTGFPKQFSIKCGCKTVSMPFTVSFLCFYVVFRFFRLLSNKIINSIKV